MLEEKRNEIKQKEYGGYPFYVVLTVLWSWKFNLSAILRTKCRGTYVYCVAGFLLTAVVLPVLGVIVVARFDGLDKLSGKAGKRFVFIFTVLIYLSIGPGLGIPRAASVPFEMAVSPYLPNDANRTLWMVLYSALFFLVALWLYLNPGKLVQRIGRVLTPSLLILLVLLFISFVTKGNVNIAPALESYQSSAFLKGFTEGYNNYKQTYLKTIHNQLSALFNYAVRFYELRHI